MLKKISRSMLILHGFHATLPTILGVTLESAGYLLTVANKTNRVATQAEINAAIAWADARIISQDADENEQTAIQNDNAVRSLMLMTPAQIEAWASANITNVVQARNAIVILAKIVSTLVKSTLR